MTAIINFTPLYGCDEDEPYCGLLKIDDYTLLLDCGWNEDFDERMLNPLKQVIPDIDAVLISHPDLKHLGALPYAVGKLGLTAPIYCTLPVNRMGQMFMYDAYEALSGFNFITFDLDDVDAAFGEKAMTCLKYSQDKVLSDKGEGITITPYNAGHMVGGTIWKIKKETEDIIYAVDYNHKKDRHLNGTVLESFDSRPSVLITDAYSSSSTTTQLKPRDRNLIELTTSTLRQGGNVLMPVDSGGRVLELLLVLHNFWMKNKGMTTYYLVFLSPMAYNVMDAARSQIEWMGKTVMELFDKQKESPFNLRKVKLCYSSEEVLALDRPYVCLATSETLGTSFAQDIFLSLAGSDKNLVLCTQKVAKGTVAAELMQTPTPPTVTFVRKTKVDLTGNELKEYKEKKKLEEEQKALERAEVIEIMSDMEDEEDIETEETMKMQLEPLFPMFPYVEEERPVGVYGEVINPDDYQVKQAEKKEKAVIFIDDSVTTEVKEDIPTKTILKGVIVDVRCRVEYVDFEGRVDSTSASKVVARLAPRRLIILHGAKRNKERMKRNVRKECNEIFIPANGQYVDITSETNIHRVNLDDVLIQGLEFVQVGEYDIAYAEGQVNIDYQKSNLPLLVQAPKHSLKGHNGAVFLGNLTLKDLASVLIKKGFKAEFYKDGVLVCCDGLVHLKKASNTQIVIEGAFTEEYFQIRDILYGLYEIL